MLKNKKILLAYFAAFEDCPRPKRFYRYFRQDNTVHIASRDANKPEGPEKHFVLWKSTLSPFLIFLQSLCLRLNLLRIFSWIEQKAYVHTLNDLEQYDFIVVHNIDILPFFKDHLDRVIFDAREMYALQDSANSEWQNTRGRLYTYLCRRYLPKCHSRITVSESIKVLYEDWLKVPFLLVRNCPDIEFTIVQSEQVQSSKVHLVHHGIAAPNRQLEVMIDLMALLDDRFTLHFMLVDNKDGYYQFLQEQAKGNSQVSFVDPVKFEAIQERISHFDIGIYLNRLKGDQNDYCLPNKFFEFIGAGLMLVASGSRDMGDLIEQHRLGLYFDNCNDLVPIANALNSIDQADLTQFKKNAMASKTAFSFENEIKELEQNMTASND